MIVVTFGLTAAFISGCGGGGSSSADSSSSGKGSNVGYYLDNAVEGVSYLCGTKRGTTDKNGRFYFDTNASCTFSVADIPIRYVAAADLSKNVKIYEDNAHTARFLQSLDYDGVIDNGIQIKKSVIDFLKDRATNDIPQTDLDIQILIGNLKQNDPSFEGKNVNILDALSHINATKLANEDERNEVLSSLESLLFKLGLRVHVGNTFRWDADLEINRLTHVLSYLNSKIDQAANELADEDLTDSQKKEIDELLSHRDALSTLVSKLKNQNDTLVQNVKKVKDIKTINMTADNIDQTTQSNVRKYFEKLGARYMISIPGINASLEERYMYEAAEIAYAIDGIFTELHMRMDLLKKAYATMYEKLHKAYLAENSNEAGSGTSSECKMENYSNVDLGGQANPQCQYAFFLQCEKGKYPQQAVELERRIQTVCSILDSFKPYGGLSSKECNYCKTSIE